MLIFQQKNKNPQALEIQMPAEKVLGPSKYIQHIFSRGIWLSEVYKGLPSLCLCLVVAKRDPYFMLCCNPHMTG